MPALTRLLNSLAPLKSHAFGFLSQLSVSHLKRANEGLIAVSTVEISEVAGVEGVVAIPSSPLLSLDELVLVLAMLSLVDAVDDGA